MPEHQASVVVHAPVHQVYELFTHFNDYPKFMSHIKEVTYYDDQRSHWVADIVGRHEWDAVNDNWQQDFQLGWRSTDGLENSGRVMFSPRGDKQTQVTVVINYNPPAGILGNIGEALGAGKAFENALQSDLMHFARMVQEAPPGALDPTSSAYLFHGDSAARKGQTTEAQDESMGLETSGATRGSAGTGPTGAGSGAGASSGVGSATTGNSTFGTTDSTIAEPDLTGDSSLGGTHPRM